MEFRRVIFRSAVIQYLEDGVWLDRIRHSNRLCHRYERVRRRLDQLLRSEPMMSETGDAADPRRCQGCSLMLEFPGELCPRCIDHGRAFARVLQIIRPYWRRATALMSLLLVGIVLDMAWPMLTRHLVDFVLAKQPPPQSGDSFRFLASLSPADTLMLVVGALAGVHVMRAGVNVLSGRISAAVGNAVTFDVRSRLVR